jgi:membrane-bound metal-dependent hydrolase YbcI (DUF457 family)
LGTLFLASQFIDLLWPLLLLTGTERVSIVPGITVVTPLDFTHYPWSHSLLAVAVWALLFAATYYLVKRYRVGAWVCGATVLSHWMLDFLVHRPDLPIVPGSDYRVGFGLWGSLAATLAIELLVFGGGLALYLRTTSAVDRVGSIGLWSLVGFLVLTYAGNLFGAPPPSVTAIAWLGQAQWLIIAWGYWIDRHRVTRRQAG